MFPIPLRWPTFSINSIEKIFFVTFHCPTEATRQFLLETNYFIHLHIWTNNKQTPCSASSCAVISVNFSIWVRTSSSRTASSSRSWCSFSICNCNSCCWLRFPLSASCRRARSASFSSSSLARSAVSSSLNRACRAFSSSSCFFCRASTSVWCWVSCCSLDDRCSVQIYGFIVTLLFTCLLINGTGLSP